MGWKCGKNTHFGLDFPTYYDIRQLIYRLRCLSVFHPIGLWGLRVIPSLGGFPIS